MAWIRLIDLPAYSQELTLRDFHPFASMRVWFGTQSHFHADKKFICGTGINGRVSSLAAELFEEEMHTKARTRQVPASDGRLCGKVVESCDKAFYFRPSIFLALTATGVPIYINSQ